MTAEGRAELEVSFGSSDGRLDVNLAGELDLSNVEMLEDLLEPHLARDPLLVVFDMSALRFLDSSGIGLLLGVVNRCGKVTLRRPSEIIRQIIEYMGLSELLLMEQ